MNHRSRKRPLLGEPRDRRRIKGNSEGTFNRAFPDFVRNGDLSLVLFRKETRA